MCPLAHADGRDGFGLVDEAVPSLAGGVDEGVLVVEDTVREPVLSEVLADWSGIMQADAYGGYARLYDAGRQPAPITEAGCWSYARSAFFVLADIEASARRKADGKKPAPISPLGREIVHRINWLFEVDRPINGRSSPEWLTIRRDLSAPMMDELEP